TKFSWMTNRKFYTLTSVADAADELLFTRLGASDPEFNLRRDAAFMVRRNDVSNTVFVTVIEPHGSYSPVSENALDSNSNIAELKLVHDDESYTAVSIEDLEGHTSMFIMSNMDATASKRHELKIEGKAYQWSGPYSWFE
ncbi:MAG: hypothetical protein WBM36_03760, partial [Lysobacterales bacterium]